MHDFRCTSSEDMFYPLLARQVRHFKETEGGQMQYSQYVGRVHQYAEEMPENIQALYRYSMTGEAMDELTEKLEKAVEAG